MAAGALELLPVPSPPRCRWGDGKKSQNPRKHTLNSANHGHVFSWRTERGHMLCSRSPTVSQADVKFDQWQLPLLMSLEVSEKPLCTEESPVRRLSLQTPGGRQSPLSESLEVTETIQLPPG